MNGCCKFYSVWTIHSIQRRKPQQEPLQATHFFTSLLRWQDCKLWKSFPCVLMQRRVSFV